MSRRQRDQLLKVQTNGLRALLADLARGSEFYRCKIDFNTINAARFEIEDLASLPFTTKSELAADQERHSPYGSLLTQPLSQYVRLHRTSGTTGQPLRWLDTQESWSAFLDCWVQVFSAANVSPGDRVFVAFSFGPFIGFWGAFEAAQRMGCLVVSGGSQTTAQRLQAMVEEDATVLVCTPTYGLHLAEAASREGIDLASSSLTTLIHAGEPGASVENIHRKLKHSFNATVYDHAGATEIGAWGFPATYPGAPFGEMCINDAHFIAEVIDPETSAVAVPAADGSRTGELVLSSFSRRGSALLRYRTGDSVCLLAPDPLCSYHRLRGGVLGRIDDMFVIRGVNVFPAAIENVVLGSPGVAEFQATVIHTDGLAELEIVVEASPGGPTNGALETQVAQRLKNDLSLRVGVTAAKESLPRYELKARRFRFERRTGLG